MDNQILGPGDWQVKNPNAAPGGWAFEFRNDFYPDVDDTAFVLMALGRVADPGPERLRGAIRRGLGLAAQHAKWRRRLGRVRSRKQSAIPESHSVRGPQRDARSFDRGCDRARRGMPGADGLVAGRIRCCSAPALSSATSNRRRFVVWPLGRELHLRHQRRAARAGNDWIVDASPIASAPRTGCARCRIPTAASASRSFPITIPR